jgi:hypothetical protein
MKSLFSHPHDLRSAISDLPSAPARRSQGGRQLVDAHGLLQSLFDESSRPSLRWVRTMQKRRLIPYIKVGHLVRFDVEKVRAVLDERFTVQRRR